MDALFTFSRSTCPDRHVVGLLSPGSTPDDQIQNPKSKIEWVVNWAAIKHVDRASGVIEKGGAMDVFSLILAGGEGSRLSILAEKRAKPAMPFAGKYRIIDFTLSNCTNSGLFDVAVLTQYRPHSLNEHIGTGRPWDLDRTRGGVRIWQPYRGRADQDWYRGTADALYQNRGFIAAAKSDTLLVLSGDHIYKQDCRAMLRQHEQTGADLTIAVMDVPREEAHRFGIMTTDSDG